MHSATIVAELHEVPIILLKVLIDAMIQPL